MAVKRKLVKLFPFLSSDILFVPFISKENIFAPIIIWKDKIYVRYDLYDSKDVPLLIYTTISAALMFKFYVYFRARNYRKIIYNLAAAIYTNEMVYRFLSMRVPLDRMKLLAAGIELSDPYAAILKIDSPEDLLKMSIEDIYIRLLKVFKQLESTIKELAKSVYSNRNDLNKINKLKMEFSVKLSEITEYKLSHEDINKIFNDILQSIDRYIHEHMLSKLIGKMDLSTANINPILSIANAISEETETKFASPTGEMIGNLVKLYKMTDPRFALIYKALNNIYSSIQEYMSTYKYDKITYKTKIYKRKFGKIIINPQLYKDYTKRIVVAIDTSGSISETEYILFVNALLDVIPRFKNARVDLFLYSTEHIKLATLNKVDYNRLQELLKKRIGYGGTKLESLANYLKEHYNLHDTTLVLLTDGYIYDIGHEEVIDVLNQLQKVIFVTTENIPEELNRLKNVEIVSLRSEDLF